MSDATNRKTIGNIQGNEHINDVIERMQIGSRPLIRGAGSGVDTIRAVPWMFAWSQSRHMLPGWFGFGAAVESYLNHHPDGLPRLLPMVRLGMTLAF